MSGLLDTGFLLAVINADDTLHESCMAALVAMTERLKVRRILTRLSL